MLKNGDRKKGDTSFHISLGEEGAVVAYCIKGEVHTKMFVRSTADVDTTKLKQLLLADANARIYIYLDTLDQSYVQKNIPSAGTIGLNKIVARRIEKDIPKNYLKTWIHIGRAEGGRKDHIFTFISAPIEPPLTAWLDFLLPYNNIINAISFLPIELYDIIKALKDVKIAQQVQEGKITFKDQLKGYFSGFFKKGVLDQARWELFISQHKTGGFRQVAFHDKKIVFSRLINDINHPDSDVVAGNIEQEISSSVEYLSRLGLSTDNKIDMYIVLSEAIIKDIRKDKLKASNVYMYSPHSLANEIKVTNAQNDRDKFSDPVILGYFSKLSKRIQPVHTVITEKVYKYTSNVIALKRLISFIIPALILAIFLLLITTLSERTTILSSLSKKEVLSQQTLQATKGAESITESIGQVVTIDQLIEIYYFYRYLTSFNPEPITEAYIRLYDKLPDYVRLKYMKWILKDPQMIGYSTNNTQKAAYKPDMLPLTRDQDIELELDFHFKNDFIRPEELQIRYQEFSAIINSTYEDYLITIGDLPQGLVNMQATADNKIYVKIKLLKSIKAPESEEYKKSLNKKKSKFNKYSTDKAPVQQKQGDNKADAAPQNLLTSNSAKLSPSSALTGGY